MALRTPSILQRFRKLKTLPDRMKDAGYVTGIWDCRKLEEVVIPPSVITIHAGVFRDCESLQEVVIPDSVVQISNSAFRGCASLSNVSLPAGEIRVAKDDFSGCPKVKIIRRGSP